MNIIDVRDKGNVHRKRMKDQYDSAMTLGVQESGTWYPLLQEGMITFSDGTPYFYIMRGTLSRYFDELEVDYEGSINVGHTDLATFPDRVVGRWTKANMRVVDIEDGRQRLETNLPLNHEHPIIKALEQAEFDVGLSVEMSLNVNEDLTDNQELNPFGVPIVDRLFVYDYAIVGNAGDVNSMGVHLKGGTDLQMSDIAKLLSKEGGENIADITKLMDKALSDAEQAEEKVEASVEEPEQVEETVEETVDETVDETVEEEAAGETEEESTEDESSEEEDADAESFMAVMEKLADEIKALREENADLKEQLAAKKAEEAEFVNKFKKLSVSLSPKAEQAAEHKKVYTDGIGE